METDQKKGSYLTRALAVIEKAALAERPLTPTEINNELQIPKATIHRLCQFLEDEQFLQKSLEGKRLIPGSRLRKIALGVFRNDQFRLERSLILQQLSDDIGETCNISVPDGIQMRYVERAESHWPLRMQLPVGTKVPLYCTSSGKLYLSTLPEKKLNQLISTVMPSIPNESKKLGAEFLKKWVLKRPFLFTLQAADFPWKRDWRMFQDFVKLLLN